MRTYQLLRNNKQTGPHTLESLQEMGLKPYDLIWVEGKSAAWRYASEIEEFRALAPAVEEQPFDRFYNRPKDESMDSLKINEVVLKPAVAEKVVPVMEYRQDGKLSSLRENAAQQERNAPLFQENLVQQVNKIAQFQQNTADTEGKEPIVKESNLKSDDHPENAVNSKPSEIHRPKYVSVSFPANSPRIIIPDTHETVQGEKAFVPEETENIQLSVNEQANLANDSNLSGHLYKINLTPEIGGNGGFVRFLQVAGISIALVSLVGLGILIGMEIGSKKTALPEIRSQGITGQDPGNVQDNNKIPADLPNNEKPALVNDLPLPVSQDPQTASVQKKKSNGSSKIKPDEKKTDPADQKLQPLSETVPAAPAPDPEKEVAKSKISSQVSVAENKYKVAMFGGIDNLQLTVNNSSAYPVDLVVVEVTYLQSNKKPYKTETVRFRDIAPHSSLTLEAPKTSRGIRADSRITYLVSKALDVAQNF